MRTLLLAVYVLVVLYVLYQMALSLEDKLEDKVDIFIEENTLSEQSQSQIDLQKERRPLAGRLTARVRNMSFGKEKKVKRPVLVLILDAEKAVDISPEVLAANKAAGIREEITQELEHSKIIVRISPINEQPLKPPIMYLSVFVLNDTYDTQVYINWDRSSIEMFGQGNRVIRNTPNYPIDLSQSQVSTVINPGMNVSSNVTAEPRYVLDKETGSSRQTPLPLVNLKDRIDMSKLTDPKSGEENVQSLYALDLMVGLKNRTDMDHEMVSLLIPFIFKMRIKVDQPAFPPLRWWLKHFGKRRPPQSSWLWGNTTKVYGDQKPKN